MDDKNGGGYGGSWKKWIWVYVVVSGVAYLAIYFLFLRDGGY